MDGPLGRSSSGKGSKPGSQLNTPKRTDQEKVMEVVLSGRVRITNSKSKDITSIIIRLETDQFSYTTSNPNKPKQAPKTVTIPLVLVWVRDLGSLLLEVLGPEHSLQLACEDEEQKQHWMSHLQIRIHQSIKRFKAGDLIHRSNCYTFINAKSWEYEGEWKDANIFGRGRLGFKVGTPQQVTYNGYFNFYAGVGYGTKVVQKTKGFKDIGWEFNTPFDGHIKEFVWKELSGLLAEDLEEIKKRGQIKFFAKGESIFSRESTHEEDLYILKTGSVRLTKRKFAINVGIGEFFGSVLTTLDNKTCFNAHVMEDSEVWHVSLAHLQKDFQSNGLLLRLFYQMASVLGQRWHILQELKKSKEFAPLPALVEEPPLLKLNRSVRAEFFVRRGAFKGPSDDNSDEEKETGQKGDSGEKKVARPRRPDGSLSTTPPPEGPESTTPPEDTKAKPSLKRTYKRNLNSDPPPDSPKRNTDPDQETTDSGPNRPQSFPPKIEVSLPRRDSPEVLPPAPNPPESVSMTQSGPLSARKKHLGSRPLKEAPLTLDLEKPEGSDATVREDSDDRKPILKGDSDPSLNIRDPKKSHDSDKSSSSEKTVPLPKDRTSPKREKSRGSRGEHDLHARKKKEIPSLPETPDEKNQKRAERAQKVGSVEAVKPDPSEEPTTELNTQNLPPQPVPGEPGRFIRSLSEPNVKSDLTRSVKKVPRLNLGQKDESHSPPQEDKDTVGAGTTDESGKSSLRTPMRALKSLLGTAAPPPQPSSPRKGGDEKDPPPAYLSPRSDSVQIRRTFSEKSLLEEETRFASRRNTPPADKDKKILSIFGFDESTPILQRYHAWLGISGNSTLRSDFWGVVYLLTKFICFMPEEEEKKTFMILPLTSLNEYPVKHSLKEVKMRIKKGSPDVTLPTKISGMIKIQIIFNTLEESLRLYEVLNCLLTSPQEKESLVTLDYVNKLNDMFHDKVSDMPLFSPLNPESFKINTKCRDIGIRLFGPGANQAEQENKKGIFSRELGDEVAVTVTTTYPRVFDSIEGKVGLRDDRRLGDPICDQFCLERYDNVTIFALSDGCNWGEKVARAAENTSRTFVEYIRLVLFNMDNTFSTFQLFQQFLDAFVQAHLSILSPVQSYDQCGTTTLLGGVLCQIDQKAKKWALLLLNLGDCKAYRICTKGETITVQDLTLGSRKEALVSCNDCGGRLGPYNDHNFPDLRNLTAYMAYPEEGEFILTCSDGVYDNLDPQALGITISELGLEGMENVGWDKLPTDPEILAKVAELKHNYTVQKIVDILTAAASDMNIHINDLTPADIRNALVKHCFQTTKNCRDWMELDFNNIQPPQTKDYAGKPDHVSCLVWKVVNSSELIDKGQEAFSNLIKNLSDPITGINKQSGLRHLILGDELLKWIEENQEDALFSLRPMEVCQRLLDFNFISTVPTLIPHESSSFSKSLMYRCETNSRITQKDWRVFEAGSRIRTFKLHELILEPSSFENAKPRFIRLRKGKCQMNFHNGSSKICSAPETFICFGKLLGLVTPPLPFRNMVAASDDVEISEYDSEFLETLFYANPDIGKRFYHQISSIVMTCIFDTVSQS